AKVAELKKKQLAKETDEKEYELVVDRLETDKKEYELVVDRRV
ncbi:hypothetical protein Tco_0696447, partial [Tanacetum coccineum]